MSAYQKRPYVKKAYAPRSYVPKAAPKAAPKRTYVRRAPYARNPSYRGGRFYPLVGGAVGGLAGGPQGAAVGSMIGAGVGSFISGFGDYQVQENVFLKGSPPIVKNVTRNGSGDVVISFREFIGNVTSAPTPNTFELTSYKIVPTNESSFPWLSGIAGQFQQWEPQGIVYEYRSTSANALNSTNTALGVVMMATNYNAALPNFESESEMLNSEYSSSVKPADNVMHMIECKRSASVLGDLYTRTTGDEDVRFSQLGNFQIATDGFQAADVQIGQLWISYQIALSKPKLYDSLGLSNGMLWITSESATSATPLGFSGSKLRASSNMNTIAPTGTVFTFPYSSVPKQYVLQCTWTGISAVCTKPLIVFSQGAVRLDGVFFVSPGVESNESASPAATNTYDHITQLVSVEGGSHDAIATFSGFTIPSSAKLDLKLIEVSNDFESTIEEIDYLASQ